MNIRWDREADAAYINLIPDAERVHGVTAESVTLEDVARGTGLEALESLVLDFDRDGKTIGIEVLAPRQRLRDSTLGQATCAMLLRGTCGSRPQGESVGRGRRRWERQRRGR